MSDPTPPADSLVAFALQKLRDERDARPDLTREQVQEVEKGVHHVPHCLGECSCGAADARAILDRALKEMSDE